MSLIVVFSSSDAGVATGCVAAGMPIVENGLAVAIVLLAGTDAVAEEATAWGGVTAAGCGVDATGIIFFDSEVICGTGFVAQPVIEIMARNKNRLRRKVSAR